MEATLNQYIDRVDEIMISSENTKLHSIKTRNANELKSMVIKLENTLNHVKNAYKLINDISPPKEIVPIKPTNILQWHPDLNQYSLKINNLQLRGNFAKIYPRRMIKNKELNIHQIVPCASGNACKNILGGSYCKFWHDPIMLLNLKNSGQITEKFYLETIKYTRNFTDTSWLYDPDGDPKNVRTFGSKDTLDNDISLIKVSKTHRFGVEEMKMRVMSDLLVLLSLNENGIA